MPKYRSATTTHGRNMAGARALWRATGVKDETSANRLLPWSTPLPSLYQATYT